MDLVKTLAVSTFLEGPQQYFLSNLSMAINLLIKSKECFAMCLKMNFFPSLEVFIQSISISDHFEH